MATAPVITLSMFRSYWLPTGPTLPPKDDWGIHGAFGATGGTHGRFGTGVAGAPGDGLSGLAQRARCLRGQRPRLVRAGVHLVGGTPEELILYMPDYPVGHDEPINFSPGLPQWYLDGGTVQAHIPLSALAPVLRL